MTTAAAIDRLVHHSVILEMTGPSVRAEAMQAGLAMTAEATTAVATTAGAHPGKEVDGKV